MNYKRKVGYIMDFLRNFVYYFVDNGIEIVEIIIVFVTFFEMRANLTRKSVLLSFITLLLFSALWAFKTKSPIYLLVYFIFFMIEIVILYNDIDYKNLFSNQLWTLIFLNILDAMVYNSVISAFGYFNIKNRVITKMLTYIIIFGFLLIINRFIKDKVQLLHKISIVHYIAYLFIGFADFLLLTCVLIIMRKMDKSAFIVSIIVSVSILLQYSLILLITIANEGLKFQHYLNLKYLHVQQENYEYLEYREKETKRFRHDYRNHLNLLQILCKEKKYDDVESYIEDISERLNEYNKYISVCNGFVDAILNYYLQKMNKKCIEFRIKGKMPKDCNIVMFDMCTIISNLLDNAIEAVEKLGEEERWIEMTFRYDNLMIYCNVKNPYWGELNIFKNKILTNKNTKNHGFGLSNVKKSVELYSGSIEIKTENSIFEVLVALVNKEKLDNN